MIKKLTTVLLFFLLIEGVAHAQTTEGTEFWATFMNNYDQPAGSSGLTHSLIASSRQDATVTVSNPQTGWSQNFSVKAGSIATFTVPHAQGYTFSAGTTEKHGLKITSTKPISLYASNFYEYTYDATIVLPIGGLGKDYIVQIFENELYAKEFAVVATQPNTQVTITPHARTTDGHVKNVPYSVTLNAGETYQVMSSDGGSDFSGTRIQTNKPVAVFSGHQCINTPTGNPWCDHIVEQQTPVNMWGKQFALTKTSGQSGDRVMLTAKDDNTKVTLNGSVVATLGALESYTFRLTANSAFVETSAPAACFIYLEGARANNMMGDPASVHVSPIEQRVSEMTFATFQTAVSRTHYVNVVTTAKGAAEMMLDGKSVSSSFSPLAGNGNLRFAQIHISHGTHTLRTSADGFTGHVYGLGDCESYAYTIGSATFPLDGDIVVNGEPRIDILYDDRLCYKEAVTFAPQSNTDFTSILWKFGDGQTSTETTVKHTYTSPGTYRVMMVLTGKDGRDTAYTNVTVLETLKDTIDVAICEGESYKIGSQTLTQAGTHNVTLQSRGGCDSIVTVRLSVGKTYLTKETASFRRGSSCRWHWHWYKEAGVYRDTLPTVAGCDSIFQLTLTAVDPTETMYDTICYQSAYKWQDHTYTLPDLNDYQGDGYIDYVLDYYDKSECITHRMILAITPSVGGEKELYETIKQGDSYDFYGDQLTKSGIYQKTVSTGYGCEQDVTLHLNVASYPIYESSYELCHENSYSWRGQTYTEAGKYADTVWNATGIDALYRLTLTDNRQFTEKSEQATGSYTWQGTTYTQSGTYTKTLTAKNGCDSIVTLHLGIGEKCKVTAEESRDLCEGESISWNEQTCYAGNTYTAKLTAAGGCDSIVTLTLNKLEKKTTTLKATICEGDFYKVGDTRLTTADTHTVTLTGANGCDSVVTVTLDYARPFHDVTDKAISEGENFKWQGETYSKTGTYHKGYISRLTGCDSIYTLNLTVKEKAIEKEISQSYCLDMAGKRITIEAPQNEYVNYRWEQEINGTYTLIGTDQSSIDITLPVSGKDTIYYVFSGSKLAENMIVNGDFEQDNMGFTTGYIYKTNINKEGTYSITDDIHKVHNNAFCSADHTSGAGLMMAVNGGGDANANVWTQTITNLRPNTDYAFSAWATNWTDYGYNYAELEFCINGELQGERFSPREGTCNWTQIYTIWNSKNTTAAEIRLYNRQTGLVANDFAIDDIYFAEVDKDDVAVRYKIYLKDCENLNNSTSFDATICDNEVFTWNEKEYNTKGEHIQTFKNVYGGDSIVTLYLTVYPTYELTDDEVIRCEGEQYEWEGTTYTKTTTDTKKLQTVNGCDSIVTRTFTFHPKTSSSETKFLFTGETYDWNGKTYSESGNYEYHTDNQFGCDSTAYLYLTVSDKPVKDSAEAKTICAGESFEWQGQTLMPTETNHIFTHRLTGEETDTLITLTVTVHPSYNLTDEEVIRCEGESYEWEGTTYTKTTTDTKNLQTVHGCDSTVTRTFTFHPTYPNEAFTATICANEQYEWEGDTYSEAGDYTKRLTSIYGCDSIVTLHLQVGKTYYADVDSTICAGETCVWNGKTYTQTGDYEQPLVSKGGCDSVVTLHLQVLEHSYTDKTDLLMEGQTYTWNGKSYTEPGTYRRTFTAANGCDSIVTLSLTFNRLVVNASAADHCADDPYIDFLLQVSEGAIEQAGFTFGDKEQAQGFRDTTVTYAGEAIQIPNRARAGHYAATLTYRYAGQDIRSEQVPFTLLYPSSVLEQNWDDFIGVLTHNYNGGYDFTAFQWYENGQLMPEQTRSYIYGCVVQGNRYSALLTETDGTQLMTCEIEASHREDISVYPTLLHRRQAFRVRTSRPASIVIYDATGRHIRTYPTEGGEIQLNAPPAAGLYLLYVRHKENDTVQPVKIVVR